MRTSRLFRTFVLLALTSGTSGGTGAHDARQLAAVLERGAQHAFLRGTPADVVSDLRRFYRRRELGAAWCDAAASAIELLSVLEAAAAEGLDPDAYRPGHLRRLLERAACSIEAEIAFTSSFLTYARHLHSGRLSPRAFGVELAAEPFAADVLLERALAMSDVRGVLESANPASSDFRSLRAGLRHLLAAQAAGGWPRTPGAGPVLAKGDVGERVALLRARLRAMGDLPIADAEIADDAPFDDILEEAVRAFQLRHGLEPDGRVGRRTWAALSTPLEQRIAQVRLNLERIRWMPHTRAGRSIIVNVPGFELQAFEGDQGLLTSPVAVGEPDWPTPLARDQVAFVEVHPSWSVPVKIVREEIIPLVARSPEWADAAKMRIFSRETGAEVDARRIPWRRSLARAYAFVQEPGPDNPLGDVKLALRNSESVLLHGTSTPATFSRANRAVSHGCIRVEWIEDLARFVLDDAASVSLFESALAAGGDRTARAARADLRVPGLLHGLDGWGGAPPIPPRHLRCGSPNGKDTSSHACAHSSPFPRVNMSVARPALRGRRHATGGATGRSLSPKSGASRRVARWHARC